MIDLPDNWERCESEYNKHYDPNSEKCPNCGAEDNFGEDQYEVRGELLTRIICKSCSYEVER